MSGDENSNYFAMVHFRDQIDAIMDAASSLKYEERNSALENLLKKYCEDLELSTRIIDLIAVYRNSANLENREAIVKSIARQNGKIHEYMQANAINFIAALRRGDSKLLRLITKYGLNVLALDQECEKVEILCTLRQFVYHALKVLRDIDGSEDMDRAGLLSASKSIAKLYYINFTRGKMEAVTEHTRLMQVLITVAAILRKRSADGTLRDYVECVRIYFRNIPWPYISSDEIRLTLTEFGLNNSPLFLDSLCRDFEELFPEFPRTRAPRSLKELCRAEVRKILTYGNQRRTTTLPVAVSALCIPHTLKNYLLGEE